MSSISFNKFCQIKVLNFFRVIVQWHLSRTFKINLSKEQLFQNKLVFTISLFWLIMVIFCHSSVALSENRSSLLLFNDKYSFEPKHFLVTKLGLSFKFVLSTKKGQKVDTFICWFYLNQVRCFLFCFTQTELLFPKTKNLIWSYLHLHLHKHVFTNMYLPLFITKKRMTDTFWSFYHMIICSVISFGFSM